MRRQIYYFSKRLQRTLYIVQSLYRRPSEEVARDVRRSFMRFFSLGGYVDRTRAHACAEYGIFVGVFIRTTTNVLVVRDNYRTRPIFYTTFDFTSVHTEEDRNKIRVLLKNCI